MIVVPAGPIDSLLQRAASLAHADHAEIIAVHVIDTYSSFEADGPAANLPSETPARRAPEMRRKIGLKLAQHNIGWIETKVICGDPGVLLPCLIHDWHPGLLLACSDSLPQKLNVELDGVTVNRGNLFQRLFESHPQPAMRQA